MDCPSEDTIAAYLDRRLTADEAGRVDAHVAVCALCRRLVSAAVRDGLITAGPVEPRAVTGAAEAPAEMGGPARGPARPIDAAFGRYRIEAELGSGGMGRVYAAFDPVLERRVALKVLHDVERGGLLREARAMARLVHPHVVAVHDVGQAAGRDYIAMELIEGETLEQWVRRAPRRPREVIDAFVAAGRGLAAAHAAGIIHGDFKPSNVLRRHDGTIVVTDFGLARAVGEAWRDEATMVGTPAYMAPEQWRGHATTAATDQFAFCVALWEALTGARPYRGATEHALRAEVCRGPDGLDRAGLSRRLAAVLRRGLAVAPAARWPSMDALLAAMPRPPRTRIAVAAVGVALVSVTAFVLTGAPPVIVACPPPARDPATVWSPAAARAAQVPDDVAAVLGAALVGWSGARIAACGADPSVRTRRLACLDGVLTRIDAVRGSLAQLAAPTGEGVAAQLVDAAVCAHAEPPRLAGQLSAAAHAALGGRVTAPDDDPCARALARLAAARQAEPDAPETRDAADDAIAAAEQCGDDRMLFDALLIRASFENNSFIVDPELVELRQRVQHLLARVAQPDLIGATQLLTAEIEATDERWAAGLAAVDEAIAAYPPIFVRAWVHANLVKATMLCVQGRVAEVRPLVARVAPIARAVGATTDLHNLAFADGMAAWLLGDVAGGHAQLDAVRAQVQVRPTGRDATGVVVDGAGRPVAGAAVAFGSLVYGDAVGVGLAMYFGAGVRIATTDTAGRFVIHDAPAIGVVIAEHGAARSLPVALAATHRLVLQPTSTIRGTVARPGGPQMAVVIAQADTTASYAVMAPIAADGTFELRGVPRGHGQIGTLVWHGIARSTKSLQPIVVDDPELAGIALTVEPARDVEVIVRSTSAGPLDGALVVNARGHVAPRTLVQARGLLASAHARPVDPRSKPDAAHPARPGDVVATLASVPRIATTVCARAFAGDLADRSHVARLMQHAQELRCRPLAADASQIVLEVPPMQRLE